MREKLKEKAWKRYDERREKKTTQILASSNCTIYYIFFKYYKGIKNNVNRHLRY